MISFAEWFKSTVSHCVALCIVTGFCTGLRWPLACSGKQSVEEENVEMFEKLNYYSYYKALAGSEWDKTNPSQFSVLIEKINWNGSQICLQIWVLFLCLCIFTFNKNIYGQISIFLLSIHEKSTFQLCFACGPELGWREGGSCVWSWRKVWAQKEMVKTSWPQGPRIGRTFKWTVLWFQYH